MVIHDPPRHSLIVLHGDYDIARRHELRVQLEPASSMRLVLLDMRKVTYMEARALAEVIALKRRMPGPAVVRMIGVLPNIRRLLDITGLLKIFELHDTLTNALAE